MTMTSKGQVTLPKDVRDDLGLVPGDRIDVVKEGGKYVLNPKTRSAMEFAGILGKPPKGHGLTIEKMDDAIAEAVAEEFERSVR